MKLSTISLLGLIFYCLISFASCPAAPVAVNMTRIVMQSGRVSQFLVRAKQASAQVTNSVGASYANLGTYLKDKNLTTETITQMENYLVIMRAEADSLRLWLNVADGEGKLLFSLLEQRAEENKTKSLRKAMLADIEEKSDEFSAKMKTARKVLKQLDESIQKFDDILGYIQVEVGTNEVDKIINDVNLAIEDGKSLNSQIQGAIDEGLKIVEGIKNQPGEGEKKVKG